MVSDGGSLGREAGCYCPGSLPCLVWVLSRRVPEPSSPHRQPWAPKTVCVRGVQTVGPQQPLPWKPPRS